MGGTSILDRVNQEGLTEKERCDLILIAEGKTGLEKRGTRRGSS